MRPATRLQWTDPARRWSLALIRLTQPVPRHDDTGGATHKAADRDGVNASRQLRGMTKGAHSSTLPRS
jgi:hypothetical protein